MIVLRCIDNLKTIFCENQPLTTVTPTDPRVTVDPITWAEGPKLMCMHESYGQAILYRRIIAGCTPLINRVRRHLASQCFEIDNLDALPCLSNCQKNVENGVDALVFLY